MNKKVALVYDDVFLTHEMPSFHPESSKRLEAIVESARQSATWEILSHHRPKKASPDEIALAHREDYVERIRTFGQGYIDPDTYVSENTYDASLFAAGAVMTAVDLCLSGKVERAFCAVRPPGHHAEHDRGMGFCIFNNIAVGARYALTQGAAKIMIADFDVHHGNGTQQIFYEDADVFFFSTHQSPHYPGTGSEQERGEGKGKGYTRNFPLPAGSGDEELTGVYGGAFREETDRFDPDLIMVSAGYDLHRNDPLAGFQVSDAGVRGIVRGILAAKENIPVIFTLEGGYHLASLATSVVATLEELKS